MYLHSCDVCCSSRSHSNRDPRIISCVTSSRTPNRSELTTRRQQSPQISVCKNHSRSLRSGICLSSVSSSSGLQDLTDRHRHGDRVPDRRSLSEHVHAQEFQNRLQPHQHRAKGPSGPFGVTVDVVCITELVLCWLGKQSGGFGVLEVRAGRHGDGSTPVALLQDRRALQTAGQDSHPSPLRLGPEKK